MKASRSNRLALCAAAGLGLFIPDSAPASPTVSIVMDAEDGDPLDLGWGVALDATGNLFVASNFTDRVLQRTLAGVVSTVLGPGGDGTHPLDGPTELAVAADGSLYVLGGDSRNVFRKPPGMPWVQILDSTGDGAGHALATGPWGIALDGSGNVFVSSGGVDYYFVLKVAPGGGVTSVIDETGDGAGHVLESPAGLGTDGDGNLYVAGGGSDNIFQVTPAGVITEIYASNPTDPCDYPSHLLVSPDGTIHFACGGGNYQTYRRDPDGTLTELSMGYYAYSTAEGPNGTLLVNNWQQVFGISEDRPRCTILDTTGNGELPYDRIYAGAVTAPNGDVYAAGQSKVYRISGACGPAPDVSGKWFATFQDQSDPEEPSDSTRQTWNQSGFALTATQINGSTYSGTIDDAGHFRLENDAPICNSYFCCPHATSISGTVSPDGIHWEGILYANYPGIHGCTGGLAYNATGTRIALAGFEQCEDQNVANGDGCDAVGHVEPCWECDGNVPATCTPRMRTCSSGGDGGTSLKAIADTGHGAKLLWKLPNGPASTGDALGDPTSTTSYALCVFDRSGPEPAFVFGAGVQSGDNWRSSGGGFSFSQRKEDAPEGITRLTVKSGDKTKATVKAGGPNLVLPSIPVTFPLTVQLQTSDAGCFEATYSSADSNADGELKAKADPPP